jgi:hypothetical protein
LFHWRICSLLSRYWFRWGLLCYLSREASADGSRRAAAITTTPTAKICQAFIAQRFWRIRGRSATASVHCRAKDILRPASEQDSPCLAPIRLVSDIPEPCGDRLRLAIRGTPRKPDCCAGSSHDGCDWANTPRTRGGSHMCDTRLWAIVAGQEAHGTRVSIRVQPPDSPVLADSSANVLRGCAGIDPRSDGSLRGGDVALVAYPKPASHAGVAVVASIARAACVDRIFWA